MISEFNYRYAGAKEANVFVGIKLADARHDKARLIEQLRSLGYKVLDISSDETAKLHIRYMVGGRAPPELDSEVILRFEFPERPGALLKFLDQMEPDWNITLFHYRNHGADYGRILVGLQVPDRDRLRMTERLDQLGYPYEDETSNPVYRMFLNG